MKKILIFLVAIGVVVILVVLIRYRKTSYKTSSSIVTSPTLKPLKLTELKSKFTKNSEFRSIIVEFKSKSDTFVIYYKLSKEQGENDFKELLRQNGLRVTADIKIEYIGLTKGDDEPPRGFFDQ